MKSASRVAIMALLGNLAGCASTLSGLGGTQNYACKAPEGVLCTSVAGVYANSLQNNLPSQRLDRGPVDSAGNAAAISRTAPIAYSAADAAAMRSAPRVLRVWLSPWEDSDGDLQDQSYLYVVVDSGRWLIEHQRAPVRDEFAPIAAPNPAPQAADEAATPTISPAANLPRSGAPSTTGIPALPPKDDRDAERTDR